MPNRCKRVKQVAALRFDGFAGSSSFGSRKDAKMIGSETASPGATLISCDVRDKPVHCDGNKLRRCVVDIEFRIDLAELDQFRVRK